MAANVDLAMNCCRLCLDDLEQKENHLVFDNSLFLRILVVASVEITSADSLPKRICNDCRYQLEKSYYFRMKAKQAQTQLRKHIKLIKAGKKSNLLDKQKFQITDFEDEELEEQYLEACVGFLQFIYVFCTNYLIFRTFSKKLMMKTKIPSPRD